MDTALMFIEDTDAVKNMIKTFKNKQKSYDEAMSYFSNECKIIDKIENDSYTALLVQHEQEGILFAYINKQGGFVVDSFLSGFAGYDIEIRFDESAPNTVIHTVSPFAGPHGATTMQYATNLDQYDYE